MKFIKKIFLIFVLLVFAFQLGASVLPHAHGLDWNHATHPDCPLYQLSLLLISDHVPIFLILFALILCVLVISRNFLRIANFRRHAYHLRAPPVMFSFCLLQNENSSQIQGAQYEKINTNDCFIWGYLPGNVSFK